MISRNYEIPAARILSLKLTVGSVNTMLIAIPSELYPVGRWKSQKPELPNSILACK